MNKYTKYARNTYTPGGQRDEMWHPEIIAECDAIDQEAIAKREAEKARIRRVVSETADVSAALTGNIVLKVNFEGSHAKKKALTKTEKQLVMQLPPDVKAAIGGEKPLFECEEYDELVKFVSDLRNEFARYGIPHTAFEAAHVTAVTNIPDIEALAAKAEQGLPEMVDKFLAVWPDAIVRAADRLGPLFNSADYVPTEKLRSMFRFSYNWMAFGVPEELKQFDIAIYNKAQEKAAKVWKEIETNGVLLLRKTISDLAGGLVESLTAKEDGTKRKFYASSVTKIQDFIETFQRRNICNDVELDAEIEKLRNAVSGIDLKAMSSDAKLRESVKADVERVKANLGSLVIEANARVISYEDE